MVLGAPDTSIVVPRAWRYRWERDPMARAELNKFHSGLDQELKTQALCSDQATACRAKGYRKQAGRQAQGDDRTMAEPGTSWVARTVGSPAAYCSVPGARAACTCTQLPRAPRQPARLPLHRDNQRTGLLQATLGYRYRKRSRTVCEQVRQVPPWLLRAA